MIDSNKGQIRRGSPGAERINNTVKQSDVENIVEKIGRAHV